MKRFFLQTVSLILFTFHGFALSQDTLKTGVEKRSEIPCLLLEEDHYKKAEFINKMNFSNSFSLLKSFTDQYELDTIYTQTWAQDLHILQNHIRYNYYFENNGKRVVVKIYVWSIDDNGWRIADQVIYNHNQDGFLVEVEFIHFVTHIYTTFTKIEYSYMERLLDKEVVYEKMDEEDSWKKLKRNVYAYDTAKQLTKIEHADWRESDGIWRISGKTEYQYNENGNLELEERFDHDWYEMLYEKIGSTEYKYNSHNKVVEETVYIPGWDPGSFVRDSLTVYDYEDNLSLKSRTYYSWDYDLDNWLPKDRKTFSYEVENKLREDSGFVWIQENNSWELNSGSDFLTINNLREEDIVFRDFIEVHFPIYIFDGIVCEQINAYNWIDQDWIKTGFTSYSFNRHIPVSADQLEDSDITIYPNPVENSLTIRINDNQETYCLIRDMYGRVLSTNSIIIQKQLNVTHIPSGIYFIEIIQDGQKIYSRKIVKQ